MTNILTSHAYAYAKKNYVEVEYLDLRTTRIANFEGFEADYDETTTTIVNLVENASVFILGCPIYNGLLGSALKNLFEFVDYKALEGGVAGYILKSGSTKSFLQVQSQLVALMNYFRVISNPRAVYATDDDFDGTTLVNPRIAARTKKLVDETIKIRLGLKSNNS